MMYCNYIYIFIMSAELSKFSFKRCKENKIQKSHYFPINFFLNIISNTFLYLQMFGELLNFLRGKLRAAFIP